MAYGANLRGLDEQFDNWLGQVKKTIPTTQQKAAITKAGAEVLKKRLEEATRSKHYSHHNDKTYGHMADNVDFINTDIGGELNGNSMVGWNNAYHAANARRLNDGTIKYPADHFVDNLRREAADEVFAAQRKKYDELIGGDSK